MMDNTESFSLDDPNPDEAISLSTGTSSVPTQAATTQRAIKADYALGANSPGAEALANSIQSGRENDTRQSVSTEESIRWDQAKTGLIQKIAQQSGRNLTDKEVSVLAEMTRQEYETSPGDIFEKKFAEKYTDDTLQSNASNPNGVIARVSNEKPAEGSEYADVYTDIIRSNEYEKKVLEDLHGEWQQTGWVSALGQYAQQLVPLLSAYRLHDVLSKAPTTSILPGENLGEQIAYLKALPRAERKAQFDAAIADLRSKNLLDAMDFARAAVSFNSTDSVIGNLVGVTDAAGIASVVAKPFVRVGGAVVRAATRKAARNEVLEDVFGKTAEEVATSKELSDAALSEIHTALDIPRPGDQPPVYIHKDFAKSIKEATIGDNVAVRIGGKDIPITKNMVYVSPEDAEKLTPKGGNASRVVTFQDGKVAVSTQRIDGKWTFPLEDNKVTVSPEPARGLIPVELDGRVKPPGVNTVVYNDVRIHKGAIEDVIPDIRLYTDTQRAGFIEHSPVAFEDAVAVRVRRDTGKNINNVTFGNPIHPIEFRVVHPSAMGDFQKAIADGIKAVSDTTMDPVSTLTQMGNVERAAEVAATKAVSGAVRKDGNAVDIFDTLPSAANPKNFFGQGKALSREFTQRITTQMAKANQDLLDLLGAVHVPRGTEQAIAVGVREAKDALRNQYASRASDGIIDFIHIPPELNPSKINVDTVVMRLGDNRGLPFTDRASAEFAKTNIYGFGPEEAKVSQQGTSFYITVARHVDETSQGFRDALITPKNSTPVSMVNMLMNRLRSTEDLLAETQRDARHIATHAPQRLNREIIKQFEATQTKLTREQSKEVERVLIRNRDWVDPNDPTRRGRFFTTDKDFEQEFLQSIGKLPTAEQTAHYFNYTRLSDFEWYIRNLALYRDKARLNVREFQWNQNGTQIPWFEGKALDGMPWGGQDASVLLYERGTPEARFLYKHDMVNRPGGITKQGMDDLIQNKGFKVYQVMNPTGRPFKDVIKIGGQPVREQVHFVVTNAMEERPLSWTQVDYRPGGHSIYPDKWFVKQGVIEKGRSGKDYYYGDNAVMNFASEAQAKKYAEAMDTARQMLKANDPALNAYIATHLPYSPADFRKMFQTGHLSLDTPIVHTETGRTAFDTSEAALKRLYPDVVDATKSEYNLAANIDQSFLSERDLVLNSVKESGGTFSLAPSRQLDPYTAFNRAMGQAVRNLWMNDYKIQAVQQWLQEFGDVMRPDYKTLSNNPMYFLYHPQWNEGTTNKALLAAAKTSQRSIVNFIGAQSEVASQLTHIQNRLISNVYEKFGQSASEIVSDHALPAIKDPAKYARAVAFSTKMGFFNPIQLFVQAQSLAHVLAVAGPRNAAPGFAGGWFARMALHTEDPAILNDLATKLSKWGWKKDHALEMIQKLKASGIGEVAGETAMRDDIFDPKFYRSTVGRWIEKGNLFFNEGERSVRLAGFATAYREWRLTNPAAELTNRELGKVMSRADLLSVNMTRASAATWQQGIASIPLQFSAFPARLAEQFLGKRLTTAEKAQAFVTYSTLYGIPTATAGAIGFWPFYEDVQEAAMKRGINLSPSYIQAMNDGILSAGLSLITGHEYNFAQRYGPGGTSIFRDAIKGNKSVLELIGGPSGSILGDFWQAVDPIGRSLAGLFTGNPETFPAKTSDWMTFFSNISTLQIPIRLKAYAEYGKFVTKNNVQVGPMDNLDAAMTVLGLTPKHIVDAYTGGKVLKSTAAEQKKYEDLALQNYQLGITAAANGDAQGSIDYLTRFRVYLDAGDFNQAAREKIINRAKAYRPDLQDKIKVDLWKKSPASMYSDRFDTYFENLKKEQK